MKLKQYGFTGDEMLLMKEALDFYYYGHVVKFLHKENMSPNIKKMYNSCKPMLDQFKNDYSLMK